MSSEVIHFLLPLSVSRVLDSYNNPVVSNIILSTTVLNVRLGVGWRVFQGLCA